VPKLPELAVISRSFPSERSGERAQAFFSRPSFRSSHGSEHQKDQKKRIERKQV
jgi:hypothetical protein